MDKSVKSRCIPSHQPIYRKAIEKQTSKTLNYLHRFSLKKKSLNPLDLKLLFYHTEKHVYRLQKWCSKKCSIVLGDHHFLLHIKVAVQ